MAKDKKIEVDIEKEAARIMKDTWTNNEEAVVFVTEKVAFEIKNLIRTLRKNYWGIFDEQNDPTTGRDKVWPPLTESSVEGVVKNIDIDSKDINVRAKKYESVELANLVRASIKHQLDKQYFGELLDEAERQLAIDGTIVWKTIEEKDPNTGEILAKVRLVDLLNFAIDPTARSIQEAQFVVERALITKDEFDSMNLPFNKDDVRVTRTASRNDKDLNTSIVNSSTDNVEFYEGWGLVPESLFTGKEKDKDSLVQAKIQASGSNNGGFLIHNIERNKKQYKPYEEAWYTRVHGRWYGKGIAEKVLPLQVYLNTIINIRVNRSYLSQLGIFKIKKGSKITPQMLSRLTSNGAIKVNNMNDIEQMVMQEASQASYTDEQNILSWAERVTQAFNIVTGEELPASTPATNAVLQSRNAQSGFTMVKEGFGMFIERWLNRHALPIIQKNFTPEYIVELTGEPNDLKALDDKIINYRVLKQMKKIREKGGRIDIREVEMQINKLKENFSQQGEQRIANLKNKINLTDFDVRVYITNEDIDKGVVVQNLLSMLQIIPNFPGLNIRPEDILNQMFDLMGLRPPMQKPNTFNVLQGIQQPQQGQRVPNVQLPNQNSINQVTQANIPKLRQ